VRYGAAGVKGITVWRQWLEGRDRRGRARLAGGGLGVVSLCRGGFFPAREAAARAAAIGENRRAIDEAHGAGGTADRAGLWRRTRSGSGHVAQADRRGACRGARSGPAAQVKLAIEPLHPCTRMPARHQHAPPGERSV